MEKPEKKLKVNSYIAKRLKEFSKLKKFVEIISRKDCKDSAKTAKSIQLIDRLIKRKKYPGFR